MSPTLRNLLIGSAVIAGVVYGVSFIPTPKSKLTNIELLGQMSNCNALKTFEEIHACAEKVCGSENYWNCPNWDGWEE